MLTDNHGRNINYLRLAVTDRCNLRCYYCMPEKGLDWIPRPELMSMPEIIRISTLLINMGINKIRITGGEPFVRKDCLSLLGNLSRISGLHELTLTTNGVLTESIVPELKRIGIKSVNLSIDTIDRNKFFSITKRDELPAVLRTLEQLLKNGIHTKINAVVMAGKNTEDITSLVELTKNEPIDVRFIEEMPFNGEGIHKNSLEWDHVKIFNKIKDAYPFISKITDPPHSTSYNYHIKGHRGNVGIIAAYTRSFCGSCNRIRITPIGQLKTCLYDAGVLNIKDILRGGASDEIMQKALVHSFKNRTADGWEAEKLRNDSMPVHESMATIGG